MKPRDRRVVWLVWIAFLLRGSFYCVSQPLWEGFDEWAHFAYVQHIAEKGDIPERTDVVSWEVAASLQLTPLSKSAAVIPGAITHDAYWQLDPHQRRRLMRSLQQLPNVSSDAASNKTARVHQYEAQQPPLYYLIMAVPYLIIRDFPLSAKVLVLRLLSVGIASAVVFLSHSIARQALPGLRYTILVPVLITSLPGLFINIARVGNESLSIVITTMVLRFMLEVVRRPSTGSLRSWIVLGVVLAAALLTKAYALAFIPLVPFVAGLSILRNRKAAPRAIAGLGLAALLVSLLSGWWYWKTWMVTGTLSGEQLDAAAAHLNLRERLAAFMDVHWWTVLDAAAFSHIWVGGWSFLVVRSWMYRIFELVAVFSGMGVLFYLIGHAHRFWRLCILTRSAARIYMIASVYLMLCASLGYHSVVVFLSQGTSTALGWYLYAGVVRQMLLIALGLTALLAARWAQRLYICISVASIALDLYTIHLILIPYYTGAIRHTSSGKLQTFYFQAILDLGTIERMLRRLGCSEALSTPSVASIWLLYLCATLTLVVVAVCAGKTGRTVRTGLIRRGFWSDLIHQVHRIQQNTSIQSLRAVFLAPPIGGSSGQSAQRRFPVS